MTDCGFCGERFAGSGIHDLKLTGKTQDGPFEVELRASYCNLVCAVEAAKKILGKRYSFLEK